MTIFFTIFIFLLSLVFMVSPILVIIFIVKLKKSKKKIKRLEERESLKQVNYYVHKVYNQTSDEEKGEYGELKVKNVLDLDLKGDFHKEIHDFIFLDENKNSHQIDHIVIRENGIFCIETKNYSGLLFGSRYQEYWTQCLNSDVKIQIKNPLNQNYGHVCQLNKLLKYKYNINSLVVMVKNNAETIDIPNVINLDELVEYLTNYKERKTLTSKEIDEIYNSLLKEKVCMSKKEHIENLKNRGIVVNE